MPSTIFIRSIDIGYILLAPAGLVEATQLAIGPACGVGEITGFARGTLDNCEFG